MGSKTILNIKNDERKAHDGVLTLINLRRTLVSTMKAEDRNDEKTDWLSVIARSLAFICLDKANLREKSVGEQAEFLQNLGLPRKATANILNTSVNSLQVLASLARKKKRGQRAKRK